MSSLHQNSILNRKESLVVTQKIELLIPLYSPFRTSLDFNCRGRQGNNSYQKSLLAELKKMLINSNLVTPRNNVKEWLSLNLI